MPATVSAFAAGAAAAAVPGIFLWPLVLLDAILGLVMSYIVLSSPSSPLSTAVASIQQEQQSGRFHRSPSKKYGKWWWRSLCGISSLFSVIVPFCVAVLAAILLAREIFGLKMEGKHDEGLKTVLRMRVENHGDVGAGSGMCRVVRDRLGVILIVEVLLGLAVWLGVVWGGLRKWGSRSFEFVDRKRAGWVNVVRMVYVGIVVVVNVGATSAVGILGGLGDVHGLADIVGKNSATVGGADRCWKLNGGVRWVGSELIIYAGVCLLSVLAGMMR